jgi:hypothetical protein
VKYFWRSYIAGILGLSLFAVVFGQFFLALQFDPDIGRVILDRLLSIAVVALFVERAIEVYIIGSRRLGEAIIIEQIEETKEDTPDDKKLLRQLKRQLTRYKLSTQRIAFLVSLLFGVLIACTGLRVLDGLVLIDAGLRDNPVWQTRVWWGVDILLTGGIIGGGAAGIHDLINTLTAQIPTKQ